MHYFILLPQVLPNFKKYPLLVLEKMPSFIFPLGISYLPQKCATHKIPFKIPFSLWHFHQHQPHDNLQNLSFILPLLNHNQNNLPLYKNPNPNPNPNPNTSQISEFKAKKFYHPNPESVTSSHVITNK